jgi:N-carbamoyl-L-amino-acid hydrolase
MERASGAGHDTAYFAAMAFGKDFRPQRHGSHNPDEAMEMAVFGTATGILAVFMADGG